jgi:hypothetical protein
MNFYTYIKETIKNNLSHQSFQFFLRSWNLDHMILKCSLVHNGMTMLTIMIFLGRNIFFHWGFTWAKCYLNHLTKVRWSLVFFKNGKLLSNKGFLKTLIKLLVYIHTKLQLCLNFIFIILVTSFNFEAQIIYMWSLKLFKVNEILCLLLLIQYVVPNLPQIV